jgi:four helix bundle protein
MGDFKRLAVWRKAHVLAMNVDRVAVAIRGNRHASLRNQMIRASMSIGANIVEGRGQKSEADFARFLRYAANSSSELEYHLLIARDKIAISEADYRTLTHDTVEVRKMLHGLINSLTKRKVDSSAPSEPVPS